MISSSIATTFNQGVRTALGDRRGSATIEYALLAAVIAVGVMTALVPFGKALSQEIATFSQDHLLGSTSAESGCHRVEWTEAELRHAAHEHHHRP